MNFSFLLPDFSVMPLSSVFTLQAKARPFGSVMATALSAGAWLPALSVKASLGLRAAQA